ncbi:MAG: hypothetical protein JO081_01405 [Alphaproteobacteria bacterium]|nr:hypothetical protein [Alphaproteobacteria bacterium]
MRLLFGWDWRERLSGADIVATPSGTTKAQKPAGPAIAGAGSPGEGACRSPALPGTGSCRIGEAPDAFYARPSFWAIGWV